MKEETNFHDIIQRVRALIDTRRATMAELQAELQAELGELGQLLTDLGREANRVQRRLNRYSTPAVMNITDLTRYLGVTKRTVYALIEEGELPARIASNGRSFVMKVDVDRWLRSCPEDHRIRRSAMKRVDIDDPDPTDADEGRI